MVLLLNNDAPIAAPCSPPSQTGSSGAAPGAAGLLSPGLCQTLHIHCVTDCEPFPSHSQSQRSYDPVFLSVFLPTGKWALLYILSPITGFVTGHPQCSWCPRTSLSPGPLPVEAILVFAVQTQRAFCPPLSGIFLSTVYFLAHKQSENGRPF